MLPKQRGPLVASDVEWRQGTQHGSSHNESGDMHEREGSAPSNGPQSSWADFMPAGAQQLDILMGTPASGSREAQERGQKPKKRIRRTANEINRRFICMCGKAYGSEGSLNQHKKNKRHFLEGEQS